MSAAVLRRWQEDFTAEAERLVRSVLDAPDGVIDGTPTSRRSTCSRCSPTRSGSATPTGRC